MKIINKNQLAEIVKTLLEFSKEYPKDLSLFWNSMNKTNRLNVWNTLDMDTKKQILFKAEALDTTQKRRLWDNIKSPNRLEIWENTEKDDEKNEKRQLIVMMTTHQQVTMYMALQNDIEVED